MVRLFLTAATMWLGLMGYGLIGKHQSFHDSLGPATIIALLILISPFIATRG